MTRKLTALLLALLMLLPVAALGSEGETVTISRKEYESLKRYKLLEEVRSYIDTYYYQKPDEQAMMDGAVQGLLSGLGDGYTFYYPEEAWEKMWEDNEGKYAGIGIQLLGDPTTYAVTIVRVFRDTPAEQAGMRKGDILLKVEDIDITTATLQDGVQVMRGMPGEKVHVEVLRGSETLAFDLTKADITANQVEYKMLDDKVGYIASYEFAGDMDKEFEKALNTLKSQGAQGLIIDLRDNPGGWVEQSVHIADLFLDKALLFYAENRAGEQEKTYTKDGKDDIPLVILVNENSASASEIFSAAMKDYGRATIVGTTTFGKGVIQYVLGLSDGKSGFQFTSAQYFSPNGHQVHKVGVTPDVTAEMPEDLSDTFTEVGDLNDPQLKTAYEELLKKLR